MRRRTSGKSAFPSRPLLLSEYRRPQAARAVQEHHLPGRAGGELLGIEFDVITGMVSTQYKGKDDLIRPNIHALRSAAATPAIICGSAADPGAALRTKSATRSSSTATPRPRWARCTGALRCARGIRSRHRPRWRKPSSVMPTSCASTRTAARTAMPSSRPRTNWRPSASSSARPGTVPGPSRPPAVRAFL
jgi:hypothetical protein